MTWPPKFQRVGRLLVMPLLGAAILGAVSLTNEACLTRACDYSDGEWGNKPGQGSLIDANTWQSTALDGEWVPFPHSVRLALFPPLGRAPTEIVVWISAEKKQAAGTNFTLAGGDVAKISDVSDRAFAVTNGTCADFYVRVVARAAPAPPPPPPVDAGSDADVDANDAGVD